MNCINKRNYNSPSLKRVWSVTIGVFLWLLFLLPATPESHAQPLSYNRAAAGMGFVPVNIAMAPPVLAPENEKAPKDSTTAEKVDKKVQRVKRLFSFDIILSILLTVIVTYLLVRGLEYIVNSLAERVTNYRLIVKRLIPILRILLWVMAIYIIIVGIINPDISTLITVAASVGIAVGLASQEILKNIFGGIMIILDKPFQVGDKIAFAEYYGEVQQIGLRSTRLITPDDSLVSIPNGEVIGNSVSNANAGNLDCRVVAEIYVPDTVNIEAAKRIARKAAISSRYVYLKKPVVIIAVNEVHENNFVIKLRVKAYVLDIRFEFPFQSDMTEQIMSAYQREGLIQPRNAIHP